jgi:S-adenosylmethionine:tRNA ribosyltransferase-isomerase
VLVADFDYRLPEDLIAQEPLAERAASRLLLLDRRTGVVEDHQFCELPDLLRPGDLLIRNNTRVFPARLFGQRAGLRSQSVSERNSAAGGLPPGKIEVLLTRQVSSQPNEWECLVRPGRKIGVGEHLVLGKSGFGESDELQAEVVARGGFGERRIRFADTPDFFGLVERLGHVPLPPYISRADAASDHERYQTVYARERGSVAAPTAGLHFTTEVFERLAARGIETAEITLHVGLGTFQPVRVERVEDHQLHHEWYQISAETASRVNAALDAGRRVVAVGTTSVRALEHSAAGAENGRVQAGTSETNIFIYPGFKFRVVQALVTNFHLPKSTLLMLVCALGGRDATLAAYQHAVKSQYRFYSYGDCMLVE